MEETSAVVLAMFGTTVAEALPGLLNIRAKMARRYPATPVRIAFTAQTIRRVWRQRATDTAFRAANSLVPEEVYTIQGPLAAIAGLRAAGCENLVVQPVHMAPAEEYQELCAAVQALAACQTLQQEVRPRQRLAMGRPVLGSAGGDGCGDDEFVAAARALAADAELARSRGAALLYMGHGSKRFSAGPLYLRFAQVMRGLYPEVLTVIALVEGEPSIHDALRQLRRHGVQRVMLKPFMVVAGAHALRDMTGPPPRGWQNLLAGEGLHVEPVLSGLGEHDPFAAIFVRHAAEAAAAAGITLR